MKKFFKITMVLVFSTAFGYNTELKKAITDSDVLQVKEILSQHSLKPNEIHKLSSLAQFVADKRNIEISIAMLPEFFLAYFGGMVTLGGLSLSSLAVYSLSINNFVVEPKAYLACATVTAFGALLLGIGYKIYRTTNKRYADAINVKQQVAAYHLG